MERLLAVQQALHNASTTRSLEKDDSSSSSSSSESNGPSAYTAAMQATLSRLGLCAWHIYCTLHAARCTRSSDRRALVLIFTFLCVC
jgi:hypothetical protein